MTYLENGRYASPADELTALALEARRRGVSATASWWPIHRSMSWTGSSGSTAGRRYSAKTGTVG